MDQFVEITGADRDTAQFYLDSTNNDVEAAIAQYFETGGQAHQGAAPQPEPQPQPQPAPEPMQPTQPQPQSQPAAKQPSRRSNFATLSDLGDESKNDDEDENQAYYAGGNKSGIQQLDPSDSNKNRDNKRMTDDVFKAAQKRGAQSLEQYEKEQENQSFRGAGYRLGHSAEQPSGPLPETTKKDIEVTIYFWKDGFSVDDGPLTSYTSPEGRMFMEQIQQGRVPRNLAEKYNNADITVVMKDHRGEEYSPPPKKFKAFEGNGRTLGSSSAGASSSASSSTQQTTPQTSKPSHEIDESKPSTKLQLRMHDGTRMVAKFNMDDTVGDIRQFVQKATSKSSFKLLTTFPRKELDDNSATISSAGLKGAVVLQKLL
eukprot:gb/GECH01012245.1/.p1 GENE.gb/GECH01012245.1/~~gb/GECH01012245.1/.p1  ORF type:complete len:372 (+),score=119.03 gb/GECH01012245.1/:1-1116(+)